MLRLFLFPLFFLPLLGTAAAAAFVPGGVVEIQLPVIDAQGKLSLRKGRGVQIGPRTVVTAAHVVASYYCPEQAGFCDRVIWEKARVQELRSGKVVSVAPRQVHYHPSVPVMKQKGRIAIYQADIEAYLIGQLRFYDVAVLGLAESLATTKIPVIAKTYPGIFEKLNIVAGQKKPRMVETVVTGSDRYAVHARVALDGSLRNATTSPGDSGGPLFYLPGKTSKPVVYGIASTLITAENGAWKSSFFSRLDLLRDWLMTKRSCIEKAKSCAEN